MKATKTAGGATGDLAHDLIMRAVAEALAKKKNVNQKELLKQIPGMSKAVLNSTIERMKKRLRSARKAHEAKISKMAAVQDVLHGADTDHAANLLLGVAKTSPPSVVDDSQTNEPTAQKNTTGKAVETLVPTQSDPELERGVVSTEEPTALQDELKNMELTKSGIDAENDKLRSENARLETQLQVTARSLADNEEKVNTLETQLRNEKATVESQRVELDELRREHEKHKTSVCCSTTPQITLDSVTNEKHVLEQRLDDALLEKSVLERKVVETTRMLKEAYQECLQLRSQLNALENSQKSLRLSNGLLEARIKQKSELMKKRSANVHQSVTEEKQKQALELTEQFNKKVELHMKEQEQLKNEAVRCAKLQGAEAMRDLRIKVADLDAELHDVKYVAQLRDAFTSVDEELAKLMRTVSSVVQRDIIASFTVQQHIQIAGYLCGSGKIAGDLTTWRDRRNIFCHQYKGIEKLKMHPETIELCYAISDRLRTLCTIDNASINAAFLQFTHS